MAGLNDSLSLTPLSKDDVPSLTSWFNDPGLSKYMDDSEPGKLYTEEDVYSMIEDPGDSLFFAFRDGSRIVGYASVYDLDKKHKRAEFSFLIGDKEYQGRGLGSFLVGLLCEKAVKNEINTLYCTIYSSNIPSIRSVTKAGFRQAENPSGSGSEINDDKSEYYFVKELQ